MTINSRPETNQADNNTEGTEANNDNFNRGSQVDDTNNTTNANDMTISSSPEGREGTSAGGLLGTPRRLWNKAVKQVKGKIASGQGNEDRGEVTTED